MCSPPSHVAHEHMPCAWHSSVHPAGTRKADCTDLFWTEINFPLVCCTCTFWSAAQTKWENTGNTHAFTRQRCPLEWACCRDETAAPLWFGQSTENGGREMAVVVWDNKGPDIPIYQSWCAVSPMLSALQAKAAPWLGHEEQQFNPSPPDTTTRLHSVCCNFSIKMRN